MFLNNGSKQVRISPKSRPQICPVPNFSSQVLILATLLLLWQTNLPVPTSEAWRVSFCHRKRFHGIMLLILALTPRVEAWDGAEFCAGKGVLNKCLRHAGYRVCGLDILDWGPYSQHHGVQTSSNPLDMLTPSGMAFLAGIFTCQLKAQSLHL